MRSDPTTTTRQQPEDRVHALFLALCDLDAESQRLALTDVTPPIRERVQKLLDADARGDFATHTHRVLAGRTIQGCRLDRLLRVDGLGAVYAGRQASPWRAVVVRELASPPSDVAALQADLDRQQRFGHPSIQRLWTVLRRDGRWLVVYAAVAGPRLDQADGLAPIERVRALAQVAEGLAACHAAGLRRGEVTAANIRLQPNGRACLLDPGLHAVRSPHDDAEGLWAMVRQTSAEGRLWNSLGRLRPGSAEDLARGLRRVQFGLDEGWRRARPARPMDDAYRRLRDGDLAGAEAAFQRQLDAQANPEAVGRALKGLGLCAARAGRMAASRALCARAAAILLGSRDPRARASGAKAYALHLYTRDPDEALVAVRARERLHAMAGDRRGQAVALREEAWCHLWAGDALTALAVCDGADRRGEPGADPICRIEALLQAGRIEEAQRVADSQGAGPGIDVLRAALHAQAARHSAALEALPDHPRAVCAGLRLECDPPTDDRTWAAELARVRAALALEPDWPGPVVASLLRAAEKTTSLQRASLLVDAAVERCGAFPAGRPACERALARLSSAGAPAVQSGLVLGERLGQGGMGRVFSAWDAATGVPRAVKVMHRLGAPEARSMFATEVHTLARLEHPNIARIVASGTLTRAASVLAGLPQDAPYLCMERAEGTLSGSILDFPRFREVAEQVLDALAHAHARGVVHLDLKPSNLLVHPERGVLLSDFGIARGVDRAGEVRGTPTFMAPEQLRGEPCGPAADLFALGATLWTLATGEAPFEPRSRWAPDLRLRRSFHPRHPMPPHVGPWLRRLLHADTTRRYGRAADARRALLQRDDSPPPDPPARPPGLRPQSPALLLAHVRLVGRQAQRAVLWTALLRAHRGRTTHVRLVGPAGSGKSRLVEWLAEAGHAEALLERVQPDAVEHAQRVALVVDPTEREVLRHHDRRLLVVETARDGPGLRLGPMPHDELFRLAHDSLGLAPALCEALVHRADGLPRYVVGTARLDAWAGHLLPSPKGLVRSPDAAPMPRDLRELAQRLVRYGATPQTWCWQEPWGVD